MVSVSVLERREPTRVQPAGVCATDASALLLVTNSRRPSVACTAAGTVTRCVTWFAVACDDARKAMLSAATAGVAANPITANSAATTAVTAMAATPARTESGTRVAPRMTALLTPGRHAGRSEPRGGTDLLGPPRSRSSRGPECEPRGSASHLRRVPCHFPDMREVARRVPHRQEGLAA